MIALDSLRGIAALVVVFHHCSLVLPNILPRINATYVLRPFVAGPEAVSVFFVLSGFVLYGLLNSESAPAYPEYIAKRLIRLWPPMAAAIMASALLFFLVQPDQIPGTTDWFSFQSWHTSPSFLTILGHLALFSSFQYLELDNVIWSLAHEVKFSLILPCLMPFISRRPILTVAGTTCLSAIATYLPQPAFLAQTVDPVSTLQCLFLFVAGAAVAANREAIRGCTLSLIDRKFAPAAIAVAVTLLSATAGLRPGYLVALGAVLLVSVCATSQVTADWLDKPALAWLGRISYSLYLVHLPVLLTLVYTLHRALPTWLILCATPLVSLGVAELMYRLVEQRSIACARRVGQASRGRADCHPDAEPMRAAS